MKKPLTVYTIDDCQSCTSIKNFLDELGFEYKEVKVGPEDNGLRDELIKRSGRRGFPQVFAGALPLKSREQIEAFKNLTRKGA